MLGPVWIDTQLAPSLATRLRSDLGVDAVHVFDLGLHTASDQFIFDAAREAAGVVITKDVDFVQLLDRHGPPPCVVWITIGNAPTSAVWEALRRGWPRIRALLDQGEALIEITRSESPENRAPRP